MVQIELVEGNEFVVYINYAKDISSASSIKALQSLLARQDVSVVVRLYVELN